MTVFTLAVFLISIWSLAFYASRMLREDMQRLLSEQQVSTVAFVAAEVDYELNERLRALDIVAASVNPAMLRNTAALQALLEQRPILQILFNGGVQVFRPDGTVIAELPLSAGRIGVNYMDREFLATALKDGKSTIGRPVMGKKLLAPVFGMTVPMRDRQGAVIGALMGATNLNMPNFLDRVSEGHYGKTGGYLLVSPQHRLIVTASDKTRIMEALPVSAIGPLIERRLHGQEGTEVFVNPRGVEVLSSAKVIPVAGWIAVATLPTEEAFAPIRAVQQRMLLATLFLTLLAGSLTWWMLRRQLAPMLATAKALATLSDTNQAPQPLPIARQDEVGELIGGFNAVVKTLQTREKALKESEERYRTLVEWSPEPFVVHQGGKLIYANSASIKMFGASSAQDLLGKPFLDLVHPDFRQIVLARIQTYIDHGTAAPMIEQKYLKLDGTVIDVEVQATSIAYDGQAAAHVSIRDITERKTKEDALRKSIAFADSLSEAMPLPVFHKDASGRYTGCNSAFTRFVGRTKDEIVGKTVFEVSPQKFAKTYKDRDLDLLNDPIGTQTYESTVAQADGTVRDVIFHKARLADNAGNSSGIVGVITDVTELKQIHAKQRQLEAQLRESQKMESLGTLAGGVAHDFNNIVAAIIGNAELARQDVGPEHPAQQSLHEICKASVRAKDLVQQILAFGRRQTLERKVISLVPVVQEAGKLLRSTLPAGIDLDVQCDLDVPAVLADATQIEQVVLNLCSNAWHAVLGLERAGRIEVRLKPEVRGGLFFASLTVRDNGKGMDEATQNRIFEPFFTTKPLGEGTGLGLSVVHGILKEHEASIEVDSAPGNGSTFFILFPQAQASAQVAAVPAPDAASTYGQGERVLYVDDDEAIVFLITRLLERQGYRVSGYTDPREALAAVRARPNEFDLAVSDYNMPGMSGLEVARALKEIRVDLPVALASGYITDELRTQAPAAGVSELIYKPNTIDDLCEAVARLAQKAGKKSKHC